MNRLLNWVVAASALVVVSPILATVAILIWLQDFHSPWYRGERVGRNGRRFQMVKFRSMVIHADRTGVQSTAGDDRRITGIGRWVRRCKLDELPQLWNVVLGDMSLVGPRPNVPTEVALYSDAEAGLLSVRPGMTDFASIVFSDEGEILRGSEDPDRDYRRLIRPWKSRLGLQYIAHRSLWLDTRLIVATLVNAVARHRALAWVAAMLAETGADPMLVSVARRQAPLTLDR